MKTTTSNSKIADYRMWILTALFMAPLLIMMGKLPPFPTSALFTKIFSLTELPPQMHAQSEHILFVPLGAMLVVLFRLTLGIRLLGPFRPILIAIAFRITGIGTGLIFLAMVMAIIALIRPLLRGAGMPYFARVSVLLSTVALLMVIPLLASGWLRVEALLSVAYFPIVVLCLTAEGFAKTLYEEGVLSAVWRGGMTMIVALLINAVYEIPGGEQLLLRFPELLLMQIGGIMVIAEFFDVRLLQGIDPSAVHRSVLAKSKKTVPIALKNL